MRSEDLLATSPSRAICVVAFGDSGRNLATALGRELRAGALGESATLTIVTPPNGDRWVHGLKVCADFDDAVAGLTPERQESTFGTTSELAALGFAAPGTGLSDREFASALVRTQLLESGYSLSEANSALSMAQLGPAYGERVSVVALSDDRAETHMVLPDESAPSGKRAVAWREGAQVSADPQAEPLVHIGLETASISAHAAEAIATASVVILSDAPFLASDVLPLMTPFADALRDSPANVVALGEAKSPSNVIDRWFATPTEFDSETLDSLINS